MPNNVTDHGLGYGVLGAGEDIEDLALLDDTAGIKYGHPVAQFLDDLHFVGNDHNGQIKATVDISQQRQD